MLTKFKHIASSLPFVLLFLSPWIQSCKKSGGSSGSAPGVGLDTAWYLTATVNGQPWAANINLKNGAAAIAGASPTYIFVAGLQVIGKDSTAIEMIFNEAANLNTVSNFDPQYYNVMAYGSPSQAYGSQPTVTGNGDGAFIITQLDGVNGVIAGEFQGIVALSSNPDQTVSITNGKFKCPYDPNAIPSSPGGISLKE